MCLKAIHTTPHIARNDITCYKILARNMFGKYVTPIARYRIERGHLDGDIPILPEGVDRIVKCGDYTWIGEGFIHVCEDTHDADFQMYSIRHHDPIRHLFWKLELYECIIPSGTEYWTNGNGKLAARKIIIKKKVKCA